MSIPLHPPFLEEEVLTWLPAPSQLGTLVAQLLSLTAPLTEPSEPPALLLVLQLARGLPSLSLPTESEKLKCSSSNKSSNFRLHFTLYTRVICKIENISI